VYNIELLHKYDKDYTRANFGELLKAVESSKGVSVVCLKPNLEQYVVSSLFNRLTEQIMQFKGILKSEPIIGIHERQMIKLLKAMGFQSVHAIWVESNRDMGEYISWVAFKDSKGWQSFGFYIQYEDAPWIEVPAEKLPEYEQTGRPYNSKHVFVHPAEVIDSVMEQKYEILLYAARYFIRISGDWRFERLKSTEEIKAEAIDICNQILSYKGLAYEEPVIVPSQISLDLFIKGALLYKLRDNGVPTKMSMEETIKIGNRHSENLSVLFYKIKLTKKVITPKPQ